MNLNIMTNVIVKRYSTVTESATDASGVIAFPGGRLSVLTDRLFRVERGETTDLPTQSIWYRNVSKPEFTSSDDGKKLIVKTDKLTFEYDYLKDKAAVVFPDGKRISKFGRTLPGTCRTLDMTNGRTKLGKSIVSRSGVAVLDDSDSLLLKEDEYLKRGKCSDKYYFAYGSDYRAAVSDFLRIAGSVPLIPRFAFGNWWSRYHAYSDSEYLNLLERFRNEKLPFTVATIDMDWHWVDAKKRFGADMVRLSNDSPIARALGNIWSPGWTGFSPNTDLFPDFNGFLKKLNDNNYAVTVNLHPAQGIRPYEDCYEAFCKYLNRDPEKKETIGFSLKNKKYTEAYFDIALRPYEKAGVRFWWIDWQQGKRSDVEGLDPLWALNHLHISDMAEQGKRPLILSRYAEAGSHRYPLGFSGDTAMTFSTLKFQPYMTASATNIGYTWWSHDIGGHHMGYKSDDLYIRWLQFGVFSPIMRLHSTAREFMGKEPWKYSESARSIADEYLRFRHRLIPYLYSMNYLTYRDCKALIEPMYYSFNVSEAYRVKNQYTFGNGLVVAPVTEKLCKKTSMAKTELWVPEERYTDIFTGRIYKQGKYTIYRDLKYIPVFAKPGTILPLYRNADDNSIDMLKPLDIKIYRGNGKFELYLDEGDGMGYKDGKYAIVNFDLTESKGNMTLRLTTSGDVSMLSKGLDIRLLFEDAIGGSLTVNGCESNGNLVYTGEDAVIELKGYVEKANEGEREALIDIVSKYQMGNNIKESIFKPILNGNDAILKFLPEYYRGPIMEIKKIYK